MAYTPPDGGSIITNASGSYTPPDGGNIITGDIPPPPEPVSSPTIVVPWGQEPPVEFRTESGWREQRSVEASFGLGYRNSAPLQAATIIKYKTNDVSAALVAVPWHGQIKPVDSRLAAPWKNLASIEQRRAIPWTDSKQIDREIHIPNNSPPQKSLLLHLRNSQAARLETWKIIPWTNPPATCIPHYTLWGIKYYLEICWRTYEPPLGGNIVTDAKTNISQVDDGDDINIWFDKFTYDRRCRWREHSGQRDAYFYRPPKKILSGPWATVYTMINTAYLTRLPERSAIDITSMTISTDWDSLYWSIKATIGSDASLALLDPAPTGPMLVEATINGHVWKLQAERWNTGHSFGQKSRSIDGRSVSAQLGAPMAEIRTFTETNQRTAAQLIDQELENTGWTATLTIDDWLIPGNIHSYQDQTPMSVIKSIADTCRAIVESHMSNQSITIKPRYKVKPWLLSTAIPDVVIPAAMAPRFDGEWDARPLFKSVFVSGEAGGISATIIRTGSAGDLSAPMVTEKLLTATEAATSLGIAVLGASGKWSKHRIELPVFAPPATPGVILPGSIIEYNLGTTSWKGFVTAVSVSVQRSKGGMKVRQTLDVERYHGN